MEHPENSEEYKGLVVNAGIEQPSIVNPYLKFRKKPRRREFSVGEYVEGIVKGNVTVLSQAVTLVESVKPEHQAIAQEVIEKCLPYSGRSIRIGISGVPGAGKSTSIDVFGLHVLRQGGKLAVLAIDPAVSVPKAVSWAIRPAWRNCPSIPMLLSAPAPRQVRWAEWHERPVRRLSCARQEGLIRYSSKRWEWGRVKLRYTHGGFLSADSTGGHGR